MPHDYLKYPPVGIDLGTSNSVIAKYIIHKGKRGTLIFNHTDGNPDDDNLLQSSVYVDDEDNEFIVGRGAEINKYKFPQNYKNAVKRSIGNTDENIKLGDNSYSPIDLSAEIIKKLFEKPLQEEHDFAPAGIVVTTPYYFNHKENLNTGKAVELALQNLYAKYPDKNKPKLLGVLPEPVAAALNFTIEQKGNVFNEKHILVFDMGGGTLDITIFRLVLTSSKVNFEVFVSDGSSTFGGEDFDDVLMDYIETEEGLNYEGLKEKHVRLQKIKIRQQVREAKERLSTEKVVPLIVSNLPSGQVVDREISRDEFEKLLTGDNHLERNFGKEVSEIINQSLEKTKLDKENIDAILLVGGSSKIPFFQSILNVNFPNAAIIDEDETIKYGVAKGAAFYAAYLLDKEYNQTHKPLGQDISYEKVKIVFKTPHHIGVEQEGGAFSVIIPANTVIPIDEVKKYKPTGYKYVSDKSILSLKKIKVYQGNNENRADKNELVGTVVLPDVYAHGRTLEDIVINITFEAKEAFLYSKVFIPSGNKDGSDIDVKEKIYIK